MALVSEKKCKAPLGTRRADAIQFAAFFAMTEKDFAMESWARNCGMKPKTLLERRKMSEWSPHFAQLMRNRLVMGSFRYQPFEQKRNMKWDYDTAGEAIKRIQKYQETGNTEHLVDAANMCLLEFEFGEHPDKHFESVDDGEHAVRRA